MIKRYLICEDSTGGFEFWGYVNKLLLNDYFNKVDSAYGRGNLKEKVKQLLPLEPDDIILVAIDRIPKSENIVKDIDNLRIEHKINLTFTDYWCIEEVFVSFVYLSAWSKVTGDIVGIGSDVCNLILNGKIGPRVCSKIQDRLIKITGGRRVNKEQFYARLLGKLIDNSFGQFSLTKHPKGNKSINTSCWFNDCDQSLVEAGCKNKCGIPLAMTTARERLYYLFGNSILIDREYGVKLIQAATTYL